MNITTITPKKSLNKAFLKQKPIRDDIDLFKNNLVNLLNKIDEIEREENQKNHIRDFLRDTYYKDTNEINTKDTKDLVIHLGKTNKDRVGVIIEAKRPSNKNEMLSAEKPNAKAFQELVLYYLRERIEENNTDIQYCIATNIYEWYIIEASYFEKIFFRNKSFVKEYEQWREGKKVTKDTNLFYNEIVKPFVDNLDEEILCTYFDIRNYEKILRNDDKADDKDLIALFKILSPYHLLKLQFADDSNSLDDKFYRELLHIIGLEEVAESGRNIICRKKENRDSGSLIENTINAIEAEDILHRISDTSLYGNNKQDIIYNIAFELCITWINRILFLKLLEGQLLGYHQGDKENRFLNIETIHNFDELFKLFHKVLAIEINERTEVITNKYSRIPYLNSSLFEINELENQAIKINSLDNYEQLQLTNDTILKDIKKKKKKLTTLDYLFRFLDAYDFASEGISDIQEENKGIINASVLGKVFEKINGYKDGAVFTPGFITMYMCNMSLRTAITQKFKQKYNWDVDKFEDIKNYLADRKSSKDILEFNGLINSLRICDPAVGSGHFLVSLLNEIIAIKYELGLLADENGIRITDYEVSIENDELILTNRNSDVFKYIINKGKPITKEVQRIQKLLFHEKQTVIENCLFGVDINPNSVKICRLRLWIELLKNAYYKEESNFTELETLPNIDINIKCGNSLISFFDSNGNGFTNGQLSKIQKFTKEYKTQVKLYKGITDKNAKKEIVNHIKNLREEFKLFANPRDKEYRELKKKEYEHGNMPMIFNHEDQIQWKIKQEKLFGEITELKKILDERKKTLYAKAFEWRFEFPEVLDDNGKFEGFDIITGNPPYIQLQLLDFNYGLIKEFYKTFEATGDIYSLFIELAVQILKPNGNLSFIVSNRFCNTGYGRTTRKFISNYKINSLVISNDTYLFKNANVGTLIFNLTNKIAEKENENEINIYKINEVNKLNEKTATDLQIFCKSKQKYFTEKHWIFENSEILTIKQKMENLGIPFIEINELKINSGLRTGLNEVFVINKELYEFFINKNDRNKEILKPLLRGANIRNYWIKQSNEYIILTRIGVKMENYPEVYEYLKKHKNKLSEVWEAKKGTKKWYELRQCSFYHEFEKEKIIWGQISARNHFAISTEKEYSLNSTFIATGKNLKYYCAVLNSKAFLFYVKLGAVIWGKDGIKWLGDYFFNSPIPIYNCDNENHEKIQNLVDKILEIKKENPNAKIEKLESKIDNLVYQLYELSEEEIKIIEK